MLIKAMKNDEISPIHLLIGILSIIIFIYRTVVLMIPMMHDAIKKNNMRDMMNALTLLV